MWETGFGPCARVTISAVEQFLRRLVWSNSAGFHLAFILAVYILALPPSAAQDLKASDPAATPPHAAHARHFLQQRGWPTRKDPSRSSLRSDASIKSLSTPASAAVWQPLGPTAVLTPTYGLVTGRVSSIAIDPADVTGNHVFIGTTGGGVWASQNAASSGNVVFSPLTDAPSALNRTRYASISIGAVTVQPGGTGVILAGTGDPNDALDSYYGAGILRSMDGGLTWAAIPYTADYIYSFMGEGFAGFAWSTVNPQLVVAAVSQSYEGTLVNAPSQNVSLAGLYYSTDAGASWSLARITDGTGKDVQGPSVSFAQPNGNSATAVVWNPIRRLFIAAVRFHGYYQSTDGVTWTRMTAQPGSSITTQMCPTNRGGIGSIACPVFRGVLAINPLTGDTFAWTVDLYNQDQGLWQDSCAIAGGECSNQTIAFAQRRSTLPLQANTVLGYATIANGDYNLALAAVPSAQDTILLAGANDLWRCSLAMGCSWRNTTNANTCMSAQVAPYQHALAWNPANTQEILIGNDSGLWRSMDAVDETGSVCSATDSTHFQNLNAGLGSLAEVESMSQVGDSPYTMMTGLGANGTAGIKSTSTPSSTWPQILGGEGGPVAIDPVTPNNWYVNSSAGVSIYRCSQADNCAPDAFGTSPVVDNDDVAGDGYTMTLPAPFIIDPLDSSQILLGTCRLWRGPANGTGWTNANAISSFLDGISGHSYCSGDALIRSIAALPVAGGGEVIYVGMFGSLNGGAILGGHVLKAVLIPGDSSSPSWSDLTFHPVSNDQLSFNHYGLDVSSIFIDPHDTSGNTVYVTIAGIPDSLTAIRTVYRTTDGGAHWFELGSNLPSTPANSIVIDPQDTNTAYVATDEGVYSTRQISTCVNGPSNCWSVFGAGLPYAPVTQLSAAPPSTSPNVLVAGTYGRGLWQIPLWTAGTQLTVASVDPASLTFPSQAVGSASPPQKLTITNSGGIALAITSVSAGSPFSETDNCVNAVVNSGASCDIQVVFTPDQVGSANSNLSINGNVPAGLISVPLVGTGSAAALVTALPGNLNFGQVAVGETSDLLPVSLQNAGTQLITLTSVTATPPFKVSANSCGASLAANSACSLSIAFAPTQAGPATGTLTVVDDAGTQTVALQGAGAAEATDTLSGSSMTFPSTPVGQQSNPVNVTLSNTGDLPLKAISATGTAGFQVSDTCGGSLGAHASCTIAVVFAPDIVGAANGTLTVSDAIRSQTISLSGTAVQGPAIKVSAAQVSFSGISVGQTSTPVTLTISNTGGSPMANVGFQITGPEASSFSWSASTCEASLINGASCSVQIAFRPASAGQLTATLTVSSSTTGVSPVQLPLSGVGQGTSGISIAPSRMNFAQPKLGEPSAAQVATISNTSSVTVSGLVLATSTAFTLSQNTCGSTLAAGASCSTNIVFTPSANGVVAGSLTVSSSASSDPATAALVGTGGAAGSVQAQPGSVTFPTIGVGSASTPQSVTLTNNSTILLAELKMSASPGFEVASTTCGASLDPAAACVVQIAFLPTAAGHQTGVLTVISESLPTAAQVSLSGTGFDFTVTTSGPSSKTISSGQTASYVFTLSPLNGSTGTFTFSCSSLPANSSCSFNPTSESVGANSTGSLTVNIATANGASSAGIHPRGGTGMSQLLPIACLLVLPFLVRYRRGNLLPVAILMAGLITITSCTGAGGGGGGTPVSSKGNTPPGTYSILVNATANGVSHKTTLTLIVD